MSKRDLTQKNGGNKSGENSKQHLEINENDPLDNTLKLSNNEYAHASGPTSGDVFAFIK